MADASRRIPYRQRRRGCAAPWQPASPRATDRLPFVALDDGQVVAQAADMIHRQVECRRSFYVDEVGGRLAGSAAASPAASWMCSSCDLDCEQSWLGNERIRSRHSSCLSATLRQDGRGPAAAGRFGQAVWGAPARGQQNLPRRAGHKSSKCVTKRVRRSSSSPVGSRPGSSTARSGPCGETRG